MHHNFFLILNNFLFVYYMWYLPGTRVPGVQVHIFFLWKVEKLKVAKVETKKLPKWDSADLLLPCNVQIHLLVQQATAMPV